MLKKMSVIINMFNKYIKIVIYSLKISLNVLLLKQVSLVSRGFSHFNWKMRPNTFFSVCLSSAVSWL